MRRFDQNVNAPGVQFKKAIRKTPDRMGNLLSLLAFVAGAIVIAFFCFKAVVSDDDALIGTGVFGLLLLFGACIWAVIDRDLIRTFEEITGHDLDGDGYVGAPVQEFNYRASERTAWRAQLPAPEPVLREWATAALNGGSLAYASWQKQFSTRSNYSDGADRYREFRLALVSAEWATENDTHGIKLTDRGEQALDEWLHQHPNPTPLLEG